MKTSNNSTPSSALEPMEENAWLEWIKQVYAVAQWGLTYSKDPFELERYEALKSLSKDMMADFTQIDKIRIPELFAHEVGYVTPKVDIRGVVFKEDKILMVQERWDGCWSLPGGWADIGLSPAEVAAKEVLEESGFIVKPVKLLAVLDKKFFSHPVSAFHIYKHFILCEIEGGEAQTGLESIGVSFFGLDELPPLSSHRITREQLELLFRHAKEPERPTDFN